MSATPNREQRLRVLRGYSIGLGAVGVFLLGAGVFSTPPFVPPIVLGAAHLGSSLLLWRVPMVGWVIAMLVLAAQIVWPIQWILEMVGGFGGLEGFGKLGVVVFTTLLACVVIVSGAALVVLAMLFPGPAKQSP